MFQTFLLMSVLGVYTSYSSFGPQKREDVDPSPLDPIDCAGCVNVLGMKRSARTQGFDVLYEGMRLVTEDGFAERFRDKAYGEPPRIAWGLQNRKAYRAEMQTWRKTPKLLPRQIHKTKPIYKDHFENLKRWGVIAESAAERILWFSTYFSVPKNESHERAIFNGKRLSTFWKVPPNVNLADTSSMIRRTRELMRRHHGKLYVVGGDWKGWFHEIPLCPSLQRHFGVAMGKKTYVWKTLPMGWSWSPYIAQCLCWYAITHRLHPDSDPTIFDNSQFKGAQLPTFVNSGAGGFATCYYDDYIFVTPCKAEADAFKKQIRGTCNHFGIQPKLSASIDLGPEDLPMGFDFLGVHYAFKNDRMEWFAKSIPEWKKDFSMDFSPETPRQMAQLCGRMVFDHMMRLKPLSSDPESLFMLDILRAASSFGSLNGWDSKWSPSRSQSSHLKGIWKKTLDRESTPYLDLNDEPPSKESYVVATDACTVTGRGFHIYRIGVDGLILDDITLTQHQETWKGASPETIYILELKTAVEAIEFFFEKYGRKNMILVIDNSAAAWGLRAGYTPHSEGQKLIARVQKWLDMVEIVQCVSKDNVADCVSRNDFKDYGARLERTMAVVQAHFLGQRIGEPDPFTGNREGVRHDPTNGVTETLEERVMNPLSLLDNYDVENAEDECLDEDEKDEMES